MLRKTAVIVVLLSVLAAGVACRRGSGDGTPPTLPPPGPKTETLRFRLVSAQTGRPVPGARVVVRRGDRVGAGDVLAEAVSDGDGWVTAAYTVRDAGDRPHLEIDAGERFLPRAVWVDDTAAEPAPDVRTLWELRPEIGADFCTTVGYNYCGARNCGCDIPMKSLPPGDLYVLLHPDVRPYRPYFEEAARRVEAAIGDRRWYFLDVWTEVWNRPPEVPPGAWPVWLDLFEDPCYTGGRAALDPGKGVWLRMCPSAVRDVGTITHEFGHVLNLNHLPPGVRGVMCGRGEDCTDDFTEIERWMTAPGSTGGRRRGRPTTA